ncbi:MAG: Hsp70 family protein [Gammaproteobacteria bacterium]|nr:Hsp70 family protein [Gammaproteobacteria bacterium]
MTSSDKNRIFGIDLGTTYSCIAYVNDAGKTEVVPNTDGDLTTPSVVYFEDSRNVVVGKTAKEELKTSPERVISLVKRSMGEKDVRFSGVADTPLSPQEVSAHILRKLVQDAQDYTRQEEPIKDVVITCPAYFGFSQKEATRQAGEIAGLNVRYVIPEPTAAAIFYGMSEDTSGTQTVLVYDLGGGTFDVTVIEVDAGNIEVVCVDGDHDLGGANWDEDVATWLAGKFSEEHGTKISALMDSDETWQELLDLAETAKRSLTSKTKHSTRVTHGTNRSRVEMTRDEFDAITDGRLENTIMLTRNVLEKAKAKGRHDIDKILLVGGSTYMPQVQDRLKKEFPSIGDIGLLDPNQAVAKGAAVFGYKCYLDDEIMKRVGEQTGGDVSGVAAEAIPAALRERAEASVALDQGLQLAQMQNLTRKTIQNVTSKSFGVVAVDDAGKEHVANLIVVDAKVPAEVTQTFSTAAEGQSSVDVRCMENTVREKGYVDLEASTEIGKAELRFARPVPKGSPLEFRFSLSADGLLSVHATDLTTGGEVDISIETAAILTADEVEEKKARSTAITVT